MSKRNSRKIGRPRARLDDSERPSWMSRQRSTVSILMDNRALNILIFLVAIYFFIIGIKLMGGGFKLMGKDFSESLIETTSNPFVALCIGVLATAVIQSSSATTSTVVALVVANPSFYPNAIPIIIGANIGTSVTNVIVSLGHIRHKGAFRRAFAGALVHDLFNIIAASLIFPLEWLTRIFTGKGFLERLGEVTATALVGSKGAEFDLIHRLLDPVLDPMKKSIVGLDLHPDIMMVAVGVVILFIALTLITKSARKTIDGKVQRILDKVLFRNDATSFASGAALTSFVQSSSVTTSLVVPLVGGGILTIRQIFPYTLGANIGTTVTAILAALALATVEPGMSVDLVEGTRLGLAIAFVHLYFNITGIVLLYPFKKVPIYLAQRLSRYMSNNRKWAILFVLVVFFGIPGLIILIDRLIF